MKITSFAVIAILLGINASFAQTPNQGNAGGNDSTTDTRANTRQAARFEKAKASALANIEKRIKLLNDIKTCVEDSETIDELKECKPEKPAAESK